MGNIRPVGVDCCGAIAPPALFFPDMSRLVESLVKNGSANTNQGYRKLRFFSGQLTTPAGEEELETCMSQAIKAVEEWSVSEAVKRLSESLRGPAAEVIRKLRMRKKDCVAMNYIEALYAVFGGVKKTSDLLYKFNYTHQQRGERLSEYIS